MFQIVPAAGSLRTPALAMLCTRLHGEERSAQWENLLAAEKRSEISFDDLLAACSDGVVVGAILVVQRPGNMAFLWPPVTNESPNSREVAAALLRTAAERMDRAGMLFTQCLRVAGDNAVGATLAAAGFPYLTDMLLMARSAAPASVRSARPDIGWKFDAYSDERRMRFARVLELTCVGSLDCPQLAGLRSGEQVLESHRQTGTFDPGLWHIYRHGAVDAGILLAADHPEQNALEVAYLGVVPNLRRQGLGRIMLAAALAHAEAIGRVEMHAAVDAKNVCALALYRASGYSVRERMAVHLRMRPRAKS